MSRIVEIAKAADRLLNAVCGGYSTELLSSRCWRLRSIQPYPHELRERAGECEHAA